VNQLFKRGNNQVNVAIILNIFNKLVKFEGSSFLRQGLVKLILELPFKPYAYDQNEKTEFELIVN
jgi:hypothetical protein